MIDEPPARAPEQDVQAERLAGTDADHWLPSQIAALAIIATAGLMVSITLSMLVPVLPLIAGDIGASTTSTEWLLTSALLAAAVSVPIAGRLGDLYGKRLMLIACAAFLVVGSLICALSSSLVPLVIGRSIMGLSVAAIPLGVSLITVILPPRRALFGVALISAMLGVGGALALPLAGVIGEHADYHLLFWICLGGGLISLVGSWLFLTEPARRASGGFDLPGAVLLAVALFCLLLPLSEAAVWGWGSPQTIGLLVVAVVLLVVFALIERRVPSPLVDIAANAKPALLRTNVASVCVGFALFASFIGTAAYVQAPTATGYGFGASIVVGGLCLLPSGLGQLALSPVSAVMTRRFGPKITLATGALVVATGFILRIVLTGQLWEIVAGTDGGRRGDRHRLRGHAGPHLARRPARRAGRGQRPEHVVPRGRQLPGQRGRGHHPGLLGRRGERRGLPVADGLPAAVHPVRRRGHPGRGHRPAGALPARLHAAAQERGPSRGVVSRIR